MTSSRLERLKEFVRKNPDGAFALYGLAMEYRNLGRLDSAASVFADLLAKHPDYSPAFLHYGSTLLQLGQAEEAKNVYRQGMQVCQTQGEARAYEELAAALQQIE